MAEDNFFQERYFEELSKQMSKLQDDVSSIKSQVQWMYGAAAVIGLLASLFWEWIKAKFFPGT